MVDCGTVGCLQASATNATRCKLFTPTAPAKTSDLTNEIITASLEIGADTTIDVTSGAITRGGVTVRGPTNGATWNEDHGIGFEIRQVKAGRNAAVFVAKDIVLTGTPTFAGSVSASQAFVLVAQNTVKVTGNVTFPCGVVTGGELGGGTPAGPAGQGPGGGKAGTTGFAYALWYSGAGGAGGATPGGAGATVKGNQISADNQHAAYIEVAGGAGGSSVPSEPLVGGSGGGAVGVGTPTAGDGGAAVLIVAGNAIEVGGDGAEAGSGLDLSGCGGNALSQGGGAGGWLGLESPSVRAFAGAGLAANGGGGAGGSAGQRGQFSTVPAPGGVDAPPSYGAGGTGGTDLPPTPGLQGAIVAAPVLMHFGGAGGGAAGRIIIRSATGAASVSAVEGATPWFASPTPSLLGLQAEDD